MSERILSKEERKYISRAYGGTKVFGLYVLCAGFLVSVIVMLTLIITFQFDDSAAAKEFNSGAGGMLLVCVIFVFLFLLCIRDINKKKAVKKGRYSVKEGMAEEYMPYSISGGEESAFPADNGGERTTASVSMKDGEIFFRGNDGVKKLDWIPLKYRSCPKGKNLGEFPVLLIETDNGETFAVTDWRRIRENPAYAHIKPFMLSL